MPDVFAENASPSQYAGVDAYLRRRTGRALRSWLGRYGAGVASVRLWALRELYPDVFEEIASPASRALVEQYEREHHP